MQPVRGGRGRLQRHLDARARTTNFFGEFKFDGLEDGEYTVEVDADGKKYSATVAIAGESAEPGLHRAVGRRHGRLSEEGRARDGPLSLLSREARGRPGGSRKERGRPQVKQIVVFNGSPRMDGNTVTLLDLIAKGARDNGAEVKYYTLFKMKFMACQSCFACRMKDDCVINDELQRGAAEGRRRPTPS